jgi:chromosome segregation ATPase
VLHHLVAQVLTGASYVAIFATISGAIGLPMLINRIWDHIAEVRRKRLEGELAGDAKQIDADAARELEAIRLEYQSLAEQRKLEAAELSRCWEQIGVLNQTVSKLSEKIEQVRAEKNDIFARAATLQSHVNELERDNKTLKDQRDVALERAEYWRGEAERLGYKPTGSETPK